MAKTKKVPAAEESLAEYVAAHGAPDEWRTVLVLKEGMANDVKQLAESLGINWQAMIKVLIDEALRARRSEKQSA